jgi:hypothetical protein
LHPQAGRGANCGGAAVRDAAGKHAQADWGHLGRIDLDGQEHSLNGFTLTLGYGRTMMAERRWNKKLGH